MDSARQSECLPMLLFRTTIGVLGMMLSCAFAIPAQAQQTLRVLSWPGYADADLVKAFEQRTGARVELTVIGSDEQLRERLARHDGADFDVVAANTAEIDGFVARGLLRPIDPARLPNTAQQLPRFRALERIAGLVHEGQVYGVPYTYSEMGLIYDRRQFAQPPDSLAALWDPRYRGRVLAYDGGGHNFSLAALQEGLPPFRIAAADFPRLAERLLALRRNVLGFYTLPEQAVELFQRHGAALLFANYGTQQLKLLRDAGADVGYVVPREGALAWLDCWAVSRGARDPALAERWIDHMLQPAASRALSARQGLRNTTEADSAPHQDLRLYWLEPPEDDARRARLWAHIMAGDQPAALQREASR